MKIRIGTRKSALARWQAEHVQQRLMAEGHEVSLHFITTTGDRTKGRLDRVGGKGAFLKEIEEALAASEVDLAVHSLKDVPVAQPPGLVLATILERADPRDALVSGGARLAALPAEARIGTTSLRRRALIADTRPDVRLLDLRGNVDTRLWRRREGHFEAVVLAMAGLSRLGLLAEVTEALDPVVFVPAPGQGAIALETRADDPVGDAVRFLHHETTARAVAAERSFLAALGGDCNVPMGAYARDDGGGLRLSAFAASARGPELLRGDREGNAPLDLGRELAEDFRARGAKVAAR